MARYVSGVFSLSRPFGHGWARELHGDSERAGETRGQRLQTLAFSRVSLLAHTPVRHGGDDLIVDGELCFFVVLAGSLDAHQLHCGPRTARGLSLRSDDLYQHDQESNSGQEEQRSLKSNHMISLTGKRP